MPGWNRIRVKSQITLEHIRQRIDPCSDTPYLDAQVLLSHILDRPRSWVLAHPAVTLSPAQFQALDEALARLESGVPLPYVIESWEFYRLRFRITPEVLIPRPETELLVDQAIKWLQAYPSRRFCADIGTGSGCIAISVAHHIPDTHFIANDLSIDCIKVAKINAKKHNVNRQISFYQGHLLQALRGRFDLLLANLPYVPTAKLKKLDIYGREPTRALDGGPKGLNYISALLSTAPNKLKEGGMMLIEIDESQGQEARKLGEHAFPHAAVSVQQDLAGQDRMLIIQTG